MCRDLVRAHLKCGQLCKRRLQGAYKLSLELRIYLAAGVLLLDIAANVRIEQYRVSDLVRVHAVAAYGNVDIKTDLAVDHTERQRICGAELVVDDLLGIKIVDSLILARVAAVGKALAHRLKGLDDALSEAAGK